MLAGVVYPGVAYLQMATVHGAGEAAEKLGVVVVCALLAIVLLGLPARVRTRAQWQAIAALGALVLTPVLLSIDIWDTSQMRHLRHHPALGLAALILGLALVASLGTLFRRRPQTLPVLAVAALPFRLPISTGGTTSNLLIPLYLVVAGGVLAKIVPALLSGPSQESFPSQASSQDQASFQGLAPFPGRANSSRRLVWRMTSTRGLEWLLVASVLLYGAQACYSKDFSKALENVVFFYVPFGLLFKLLREVRWTKRTLAACFLTVVGLAVLFAGVGFIEYHRKQLFLNPKVVAANQYDNYFRVNSLFFDPSIYGRFLALVMLAVTTVVLWSARRRNVLLGAATLVWLWGGLITSFSQSSIAALLLGLAVLAAWRWDLRSTLYVSGALAAIALVVVFTAPPGLHIGLSGEGGSASNATNGRTKLIEGGLSLFANRPLQGYGPGSFEVEYRAHQHLMAGSANTSSATATSASHTIPVTVAAEQGVVGLALYLALLLSAFVVLFRSAGRSPPRIALAACFAALVLHTWVYADFLEDPLTWTLLGIGVALAARAREEDPGGKPAQPPDGRAPQPAAAQA